MAKFPVKACYTPEGAIGLLRAGGTAREEAVEKTISDIRGKLLSFYYAFGDRDAYLIVGLPDNISAALPLKIKTWVQVSVSTTILLDRAESDEAVKRSVNYRAPGN